VYVGVMVQEPAEGMNSTHHYRDCLFGAKKSLKGFLYCLIHTLTQPGIEFMVKSEIRSQHFGDSEGTAPYGNVTNDILQALTEFDRAPLAA